MKVTLKPVPNTIDEETNADITKRVASYVKADPEAAVPFSELEGLLKTEVSNLDTTTCQGDRIPVEADTIGTVHPRPVLLEKPTELGEKLADVIEASSELSEVVNPQLTHLVGEDMTPATVVINNEDDIAKLEQIATNG